MPRREKRDLRRARLDALPIPGATAPRGPRRDCTRPRHHTPLSDPVGRSQRASAPPDGLPTRLARHWRRPRVWPLQRAHRAPPRRRPCPAAAAPIVGRRGPTAAETQLGPEFEPARECFLAGDPSAGSSHGRRRAAQRPQARRHGRRRPRRDLLHRGALRHHGTHTGAHMSCGTTAEARRNRGRSDIHASICRTHRFDVQKCALVRRMFHSGTCGKRRG